MFKSKNTESENVVTPKMEYEMTSAAFRHHQTLLNQNITVFFAFSGLLIVFAGSQEIGKPQQYIALSIGAIFSFIWLFRALRWRAYNRSYLKRLKSFEEKSNGNGLFTKDEQAKKEEIILKIPFSGVVPLIYFTSFVAYVVTILLVIHTNKP